MQVRSMLFVFSSLVLLEGCVGTATCNPLGPINVKSTWVETNLGNKHTRSGNGEDGVLGEGRQGRVDDGEGEPGVREEACVGRHQEGRSRDQAISDLEETGCRALLNQTHFENRRFEPRHPRPRVGNGWVTQARGGRGSDSVRTCGFQDGLGLNHVQIETRHSRQPPFWPAVHAHVL